MQRPAPPPTSQVQRFSMSGGGGGSGSSIPLGVSPVSTFTSAGQSRTLSSSGNTPPMASVRPSTSSGPPADISSPLGFKQRASSSGGLKSDGESFMSMLPSKIQASLKTFEELQSQKSALLTTAASTPPTSLNTPPTANGWATSGRGAHQNANSFSMKEAARKEREYQRKLQVSEAVMKKLHRKNQKLTKENDRLRSAAPPSSLRMSSDPETDSQITRLENRIRQLESTPSVASTSGNPTDASFRALQQKFESLQTQYDTLLQCRVESITNNSSTAKINKEVKAFFVALRKKIHSDLFQHEVERMVWNEKMSDLEEQACANYVTKAMMEEAA